GVTIDGPAALTATLTRANAVDSRYYVVELQDADNITLSHLRLTGAAAGVYLTQGSDSDGVQIINSQIFLTRDFGVYGSSSNDSLTVSGTELYGVAGGSSSDDQTYGIYLPNTDDVTLTNDIVHESSQYGVYLSGQRDTLQGSPLYG